MYIGNRHVYSCLSLLLYFFFLFCSISDAAIGLGRNIAVSLLDIDTPTDLTISTVFVFLGYSMQYLVLGGLFELTNPRGFNSSTIPPKEASRRLKQVKDEIKIGISSLFVTVGLTLCWMYFVEPITIFYGFFNTHQYNLWWFFGSLIAYIFWFDTWFYWSHRWLHDYDILWNKVHYVHHQIKEPSCFAQFAVHPVEAALQGPIGHYIGSLFFPFHPAVLAFFGFLGATWAIAAHDGRWMDFNSHYYHHSKGRGRFVYFNLGFITPFWDQYCGTRWSEDHPKWVQWKNRQGKNVIFDTRDGSATGIPNDAYGAYQESLNNSGKNN